MIDRGRCNNGMATLCGYEASCEMIVAAASRQGVA